MKAPTNSKLQNDRKLAAALAELKVRGISLPDEALSGVHLDFDWPIDEDGYFYKGDGTKFSLLFTDDDGIVKESVGKKGFLESKARFPALCGGRGSGKTGDGAQKTLRKIMLGQPGAVINPDFENFRYSTWPEFREWIPWDLVIKSQQHRRNPSWEPRQPFTMVFKNGARACCKGLKNPDSARGPNLNWLWYDEAGRDETGLSWTIAIASVRIGPDPQAWATFTPNGDDHWTYDFFVKQEVDPTILEMLPKGVVLTEFFFTSIKENRDNLDPAFYASMLAKYPVGWLRDQEIDGKFVSHGGRLGDSAWFDDHYLAVPPDFPKKRIRYWDLAASEKQNAVSPEPAHTCGAKQSWDGEKKYCIEHIIQGLWKWEEIKRNIVTTAQSDGPKVEIWIEQEPGSGGKNQIAEIAGMEELEGYKVFGDKPEGDKVERANLWFADAALGNYYMVYGPWNKEVRSQLNTFPSKRQKDIIDAVSGGRKILNPPKKWRRMKFLSIGNVFKNPRKTEESRKPSSVGVTKL